MKPGFRRYAADKIEIFVDGELGLVIGGKAQAPQYSEGDRIVFSYNDLPPAIPTDACCGGCHLNRVIQTSDIPAPSAGGPTRH